LSNTFIEKQNLLKCAFHGIGLDKGTADPFRIYEREILLLLILKEVEKIERLLNEIEDCLING
jgi:hypothetical protein